MEHLTKSTTETMLDGLTWVPVDLPVLPPDGAAVVVDDLPFATHRGELIIGEHTLRCYRLSNGIAVFDADDVRAFFAALGAGDDVPMR